MRYLVPLGAIGVLYTLDTSGTHTTWSQPVALTTIAMLMLSLVLAIGGNNKHGR